MPDAAGAGFSGEERKKGKPVRVGEEEERKPQHCSLGAVLIGRPIVSPVLHFGQFCRHASLSRRLSAVISGTIICREYLSLPATGTSRRKSAAALPYRVTPRYTC